jgi:glycosyltransferase involved in cell wall biosynthesis
LFHRFSIVDGDAPRVSVIVPCKDDGRFLDDLLASLAAQTFRDFEIIIVDDGSTDQATVEKLASLDPSVRVMRQPNRHLANARNRGFREARAPFVLPLDCDDMLEPSFLAETVPMLANAPPDVAFVFTDWRLTGALEGQLHRHCNRFDQLFLNYLGYCMLVRKSSWEAVGGYDETMLDGMEDWEFNLRLLGAGFRAAGVAKPLAVYRVRHEGMLLSRTVRLHGTVWRYIRSKHADLYRPRALLALWQTTRLESGRMSPAVALVLLGSAKILPETWFNKLFYWFVTRKWRRRIDRARY